MGKTKQKRPNHKGLAFRIWRHRVFYLFLLPAAAVLVFFNFIPTVATVMLSFKDFNLMAGIWQSHWNGLANFERIIVNLRDFTSVVGNTLSISVLRLCFGFFPPIIFAILLFDIRANWYRRLAQSITYLPHFFSWVIVYGLVFMLLTPGMGLLPNILRQLGMSNPPGFLLDSRWYRPLFVAAGIWKELGWGTIIYMAALVGIDKELFEAGAMDGVGVLQRIRYIILPSLKPVMILLLTLSMGSLFSAGFEQSLLFSNSSNIMVSDIIETWVYRTGMVSADFNLATAVGLAQSVIGIVLIVTANWVAKRTTGMGLYGTGDPG